MPPGPRSTNHLLQSLPAAEFEALRPHLEFVELDREPVLVDAGAWLTHVSTCHRAPSFQRRFVFRKVSGGGVGRPRQRFRRLGRA